MDDTKLNMILPYTSMGWALIPLHNVMAINTEDGPASSCSCAAGSACRSAGKHPRNAGWQSGGWVRDSATLARLVADRPSWNWGAVTGPASGVWVLDVDPDNGGLETLGDLLEPAGFKLDLPYAWAVGALDTRIHRTGSGGLHLIFEIGADGWAPERNSAGRLGPGLDVRAAGGQIVLPGSVSGKGAYSVVLDRAPAECPAALRAEIERRLAPVPRESPVPPRAEGGASLVAVSERGQAYAAKVLAEECAELDAAPVGTRNDTAYRTACRLIEIVNAPWNALAENAAFGAWYSAATVTGAPDAEVYGVWDRARARVGDGAAELPVSRLEGDRAPFDGSPTPASSPFREAGPRSGQPVPSQVTGGTDPVEAFLGALLTPHELESRPAPRPLVGGMLFLDTCAWMIGKSGSLKSFVALDLAGHVGRGDEWQGCRVEQGEAWYVVGEGLGGMKLRVAAWQRRYGEMKDVHFVPMPVQADERRAAGTWSVMVEAARRRRPRLIVLDTQARATIGLDENSNTDMSYFAAQADRLRAASGGCVLVVHHMGAGTTGRARGATALDGAQDTELRIVRTGPLTLELHTDKQKDAAEAPALSLRVERSEGGADTETGMDLSSLVLVPAGATPAPGVPFREAVGPRPSEGQLRAVAMYRVILETFQHGEGGTRAAIASLFADLPAVARMSPEARRRAKNRAWSDLVSLGLLMRADGSQRFKVVVLDDQTEAGALTPNRREDGWMPPLGWQVVWPDDDAPLL